VRLHLGCGGVYLDGYHNVDLPPDEHGVQPDIRPDEYADITALSYDPGTIEEVRLHHVFEHFSRPRALRLLIDWYEWLAPGGQVTIETPDFARCARWYLLRPSARSRGTILRHVFGSHEAAWAVHWDGWDRSKFKLVLGRLGFERPSFERTRWRGTYNITARARKPAGEPISREELERRAEEVLRLSLVDEAESELRMLEVWREELTR
jgi:hypothetical protein